MRKGGFGEAVLSFEKERPGLWPQVRVVAIEDQFVPQGSIPELLCRLGMDAASVAKRTLRWIEEIENSED